MRSYSCFYRSIGEKNAGTGPNMLMVVLVVLLGRVVVVMLPSIKNKREEAFQEEG